MEKKVAGIMVDNYKIPTFEKELPANGYTILDRKPSKVVPDCTLLRLEFEVPDGQEMLKSDNFKKLQEIVTRINHEARNKRN